MTNNILQHLKVKKSIPTVEYLQELILAYCSTVPWESASKIVKKDVCNKTTDCLRLEQEFWTSALQYGTGGTCYESNWAFFYLLRNLGFKGYLTINKVIDKSSVHSAIVIRIDGKKYVVDIGYPTYAPIPIIEGTVAFTNTSPVAYRSTPVSSQEYLIENFPHPKPYLYHLTDIPVHAKYYLKVASDDYGETGLFSDRIVIRKMINKVATRFDSWDTPYNIHTLHNGNKLKTFVDAENVISCLSEHFNLNIKIIKQAFNALSKLNAQQDVLKSDAITTPLS